MPRSPTESSDDGKGGSKKKRGVKRKNGGQESKERGRRAAPKDRVVSGNGARYTTIENKSKAKSNTPGRNNKANT